jgi:hypothetical protein
VNFVKIWDKEKWNIILGFGDELLINILAVIFLILGLGVIWILVDYEWIFIRGDLRGIFIENIKKIIVAWRIGLMWIFLLLLNNRVNRIWEWNFFYLVGDLTKYF